MVERAGRLAHRVLLVANRRAEAACDRGSGVAQKLLRARIHADAAVEPYGKPGGSAADHGSCPGGSGAGAVRGSTGRSRATVPAVLELVGVGNPDSITP